ncbi:acyltransferase [Streptococcus equinus]|uniref:acyltransferase n=1 Tax=Streptococcus equinus TaxID=1335 RepID=UPI0009B8370C|nr:acyltransferase [Streptococcus equinus]
MKERKSNIELLRILAMFLIIAHHFSVHGDFKEYMLTIPFNNKLWLQFLQLGGKIGVDVFVIISGYFLISSKKLKLVKVLNFWSQLIFYSVLLYAVFVFSSNESLSILGIIKNSLPVLSSRWWFASTYFVLYLLSPYLNKLLNSFNKREYQKFIILLSVLWCILPTLTNQTVQSNPLLWFMYLYALAGYIRLYGLFDNMKAKSCILLAILVSLLTLSSAAILDILGMKISFLSEHATHFFGMQKLPILIISVLLFLGFSKIDMGSNKLINIIASATFGVYLIHDNNYVRPFLWEKLFKNALFSNSHYLIPYSLLVIIVVYVVCIVIELMRIYFVEKKYTPWLIVASDKFEKICLNNLKNFL